MSLSGLSGDEEVFVRQLQRQKKKLVIVFDSKDSLCHVNYTLTDAIQLHCLKVKPIIHMIENVACVVTTKPGL